MLLALFGGVILSVLGGLALRGYFSSPAETELRSVRVVAITDAAEITVLGEREADCLEIPSLADCVTVVRVEQPVGEPVRAELTGVVSDDIALVYWGCEEGPAVPNCTVGAGREDPLVCVSTSSIYDGTAGRACAEVTRPSQPREPVGSTEVVTIVPITSDGLPLPDYVVTDLSEEPTLENCRPASSAVGPDIVSCSPNAVSAQACWVGEDRVTLLCGDASGKVLRRHTVSDPLPPMGPLPESKRLPLAIELMEGTHCRRAWGGPAPLLPGDLVAPYVCGGAHGLLVHSVKDTLFDQREPLWTVQTTGPGLLQDGATLPPRQNVAFVYYAGRP